MNITHLPGECFEVSCKHFQPEVLNSKLQSIANVLLLYTGSVTNPGLNGKMGICLFFYHYSRYSNKALYEEFAGTLLDEVIDSLHKDSPVDFVNGIAGIGWAVEYLVQNKFIEADTDEILADVDQSVLQYFNSLEPKDKYKAVFSIAPYVVARLKCKNLGTSPQSSNFQLFTNLIGIAGNMIGFAVTNPAMKLNIDQINALGLLFSEAAQFEHLAINLTEIKSKLKSLSIQSADEPFKSFVLSGLLDLPQTELHINGHLPGEDTGLMLRAIELSRLSGLDTGIPASAKQLLLNSMDKIADDNYWLERLDIINPGKPAVCTEFAGLGLLLLLIN
jgi:hypothetical protein